MEYKIDTPESYDALSLLSVAHSMAMVKTTRGGNASFHKQTYDNIFERICTTLVSQVEQRKLKVCNCDGIEVTPDELTQDMQIMNKYIVKPNWDEIKKQHPECEVVKGSGCYNLSGVTLNLQTEPDLILSKLQCYQSTIQQLNEWGNGTNLFIANEKPINELVYDLEDSDGNVIEVGYYRGYVGFSSEKLDYETPISKPLSRQTFQEDEILRLIGELGFTASKIPRWCPGEPGLKAQVRSRLRFTKKVFDNAWERLRADGRIKE